MGVKNGGFAVVPYLCRYYYMSEATNLTFSDDVAPYLCRYYYKIATALNQSSVITPYLPRYHPNKKAKLNTSFAFCFLCFCYQNFFFLHSHKLRMTKSTLTPMTAG